MTKAKKAKPAGKAGRPRKEVNWAQVDKMLSILCTDTEISNILGISQDTLARACKREKHMDFADYSLQKRDGGKMSLRRKMHDRAIKDGSDTMLIWLSKNQLGWADKVDQNVQTSQATTMKITFDQFRANLEKELNK